MRCASCNGFQGTAQVANWSRTRWLVRGVFRPIYRRARKTGIHPEHMSDPQKDGRKPVERPQHPRSRPIRERCAGLFMLRIRCSGFEGERASVPNPVTPARLLGRDRTDRTGVTWSFRNENRSASSPAAALATLAGTPWPSRDRPVRRHAFYGTTPIWFAEPAHQFPGQTPAARRQHHRPAARPP